MRALTIHQPWASLIVHGPKRIENRSRRPWSRLMGQLIGIHAAKRVDLAREREYSAVHDLPQPLPHGALLGFARIVGTVTEVDEGSDDPWFEGPVGIRLADVVAYPEPIAMSGAQGYFSVLDRLTPDARESLMERAGATGMAASDRGQWLALYDVTRPARGAKFKKRGEA